MIKTSYINKCMTNGAKVKWSYVNVGVMSKLLASHSLEMSRICEDFLMETVLASLWCNKRRINESDINSLHVRSCSDSHGDKTVWGRASHSQNDRSKFETLFLRPSSKIIQELSSICTEKRTTQRSYSRGKFYVPRQNMLAHKKGK